MRFEFAIAAAIILVVTVTVIMVFPLGIFESFIRIDIPGSTDMNYEVTVTCGGTGSHINAQLQWISEPPHPRTYKILPCRELDMWCQNPPVTDEFTVISGETYLYFYVRDHMPEATGIISWDGTWRCYFEPEYHNVSGYDNVTIHRVNP